MAVRTFVPIVAALLTACGGTATVETEAPTSSAAKQPAAESAATADGPAASGDASELAPDFTLPDLSGTIRSLSELRGKRVVLEWFNPGCPFVKHAHTDGPLKDMAKSVVGDNVVWLAINSGAPGKQGYGLPANTEAQKAWAIEAPILLDESGAVGRAYGAKTTPQMFIIDERGAIAYRGALDNAPLGRVPADGLVNYVANALADLGAARPVQVPETAPYGCSVKYAE